jgi:hypothetical protein
MWKGLIVVCALGTPTHDCTPEGNFVDLLRPPQKQYDSLPACQMEGMFFAAETSTNKKTYVKVYCTPITKQDNIG